MRRCPSRCETGSIQQHRNIDWHWGVHETARIQNTDFGANDEIYGAMSSGIAQAGAQVVCTASIHRTPGMYIKLLTIVLSALSLLHYKLTHSDTYNVCVVVHTPRTFSNKSMVNWIISFLLAVCHATNHCDMGGNESLFSGQYSARGDAATAEPNVDHRKFS